MKSSDVKVGESYVYMYSSYATPQRFDVKSMAKGQVSVQTGTSFRHRTRQATLITGMLHLVPGRKPQERSIESRYLTGTLWADYVASQDRARVAREEHEAKKAAEQAQRVPQVQRIEALLVEAEAPNSVFSYSTGEHPLGADRKAPFWVHDAVKTGEVKISLANLLALIDHLTKQDPDDDPWQCPVPDCESCS